ncbi:MAG: class I SAM-dependent methyltransferase [Burkholderiaceae bacterium]
MPCPSMLNDSSVDDGRGYHPEAYQRDDVIGQWQAIARRQHAKDRVLIPLLAQHFVPGRLLELGAGVGQLSLMLRDLGWDTVSSDFQPVFVEHQRSLGLEAHVVDATDIEHAGLGQFDNLFSHSITPFITHDYDIVAKTYRSTRQALTPGGVMVMVHAMEKWRDVAAEMRRHQALARQAGYARVQVFRNQLLPSAAYRPPFTAPARAAELMLGRRLGSRFVLVAS